MKPSFKGFKGYNKDTAGATTSQTTNSTAELSEDDSSLSSRESSRETSPSNGLTPGDKAQRKSQDNRSVVRRLVDHFSNSDSDTAGKASYTTRRKKSKTLQHTELPSGGEREIRRKMATQNQADEAIKLWKALAELLKTTLDEADQALDRNESRGPLLGHKAGIVALEDNFTKVWERAQSYFDLQYF